MKSLLQLFFYRGIVRFVVLIVLGLNVRHRERLPKKGPALFVVNHNSHMDTMVLMSLLPAKMLSKTRPVAAWDYFMRNRILSWFAVNIVGILPIKRQRLKGESNPLEPCIEALGRNEVLIFYPEGSRGEPEQMTSFKSGITKLVAECPDVPVIPIFIHGAGKALPKGEALLVPFFCDVFIGNKLTWGGNRKEFMRTLEEEMTTLSAEGGFAPWE